MSASGDATVVWEEDADANGSYNVGLTRIAKSNGAALLSKGVWEARSTPRVPG